MASLNHILDLWVFFTPVFPLCLGTRLVSESFNASHTARLDFQVTLHASVFSRSSATSETRRLSRRQINQNPASGATKPQRATAHRWMAADCV
jgi:hypothetical protein